MAHSLRCSVACGIFPDQGSNPWVLHWQADSLPLSHQGSPQIIFKEMFESVHWFCLEQQQTDTHWYLGTGIFLLFSFFLFIGVRGLCFPVFANCSISCFNESLGSHFSLKSVWEDHISFRRKKSSEFLFCLSGFGCYSDKTRQAGRGSHGIFWESESIANAVEWILNDRFLI